VRRLVVLGSTGSIGTQTLEVAEAFPDRLRVVALAAGGGREDVFIRQLERWRPAGAALTSPEAAGRVALATGREVLAGPAGISRIASWPEADLVLNAIVGFSGLEPTMAALEAGKDVALANKESLVAGGALVTRLARERGVRLLPVDSEPSAIHQLLAGHGPNEVETLILTASGGPFYGRLPEELERVTPAEALRHPTWRMGPKITVDSATLMNKGLEVIEASWFFGLPVDRIKVLVHRQSLAHSMVELSDGVILAHLGPPDMRYPIQYALLHPARPPGPWPRLDLGATPPLSFTPPDTAAFPCLKLAYQAGRIGGSLPAVLSAANEVLVEAFLGGRIGFGDIPRLLGDVVSSHAPFETETFSDAARADTVGREAARVAVRRRGAGTRVSGKGRR
jgi:1-deoxy-D-xylulose-5-phosphate reductoisomerase